MKSRFFIFGALMLVAPAFAQQNLLKNGSFEGGARYWYENWNADLIKGEAPSGEYAIRINKGLLQSAAFELKQGVPVTISFSAKAENGATMGWQCSPCGREIGAKSGLTWGLRGAHPVKLGAAWQRYSFTFTPNVPQDGFWPRPTFMLQIGDADKPIFLDAVTVAYGAGEQKYVPRGEVEVLLDSPNLPGFKSPSGNTFSPGAMVNLAANVSNPGSKARDLTLRWQLFDYEGEKPVGAPLEKKISIAAGQTISESVPMKLAHNGLVLARFSASENETVLDSSDLPLTVLPYPKAFTKPDWRERFGGSFAGREHAIDIISHLGFTWARWFPQMGWENTQPDGPEQWKWLDKELDLLAAHGMSTHCVLYSRPKWAFDEATKPLPKDMQWPVNDPRWDDLKVQSAWDKFVVESVNHYKGRSLVYEIENEPELDGWDKKQDLYAKFTIRTARLIKQADAQAKVMIDNVYGIPSGLNRRLLEKGAAQWIDVFSWHDYHDGWLADATAIKRMRQNLDELNGKHIEIWFNEGWAYTNTAQDEPAVALTHYNSAQATNAMVDSIAELTVNGQEKTILFHTTYEDHGQSFWDYSGPGTMLWDWNGYPLPLVAAWNVLGHHISLSKNVAFVRPENANFCIFQDLRNNRGVMVAYADRDAKSDVTVDLPFAGLIAEDAMGNAAPLATTKLTLPKNGRPVFLYDNKTSGATFAAKMAPLDRKNASFASAGGSFRLPPVWEGTKAETSDGNPAIDNAKPIWQLNQIFPADPTKNANYHPLIWRNGWWVAKSDDFGGQPKVEMKDSAIRVEFRAASGEPRAERIAALSFIAPQDGTFTLSGSVALHLWDGNVPVRLSLLQKNTDGAQEIASLDLKNNESVPISQVVTLKSGAELVIVPRPGGGFTGGDITLRDLKLSLGGATAGTLYKLPASWQGAQAGSAQGNPIAAGDKPIWRIDQVWPDKPMFSENYTPLSWSGTEWHPKQHEQGGQPAVKVENGNINFAVRGPWGGNEGQKIAALVFIAPKSGVYKVQGVAHSKPWEGGANVFRLALLKKDTQRAVELKVLELPRDGTPVSFEQSVELNAGHELVFLPLMPDWHNATNTTIENLTIEQQP